MDRLGHLEPPDAGLDNDLPSAHRAHEDLVGTVADQRPRSRRQAAVVGDPPEERMRVEQEPHSKLNWTSSGSGASKSGPTHTSAAGASGMSFPIFGTIGTSLATRRARPFQR